MTPEAQTLDAVINALILAVIGGMATIGIPSLWQWFKAKLANAAAREQKALDEDKTDERLDNETRDITNKLALQAFNIQDRLQRLQSEYEEQGKLVKAQAEEVKRLTTQLENKDIAITEYRKQVTELVNELASSVERIKQLETDIAILETMR